MDDDEPITYNLTSKQLLYANKIRSACNNFRTNAIKTTNKHKSEINKIERTLKNLSVDKSIYITRPEKGKGIVILNRDDYNKKMNDILSDTNIFRIIKIDSTIIQEDPLIKKLKQLRDDGFITDNEYQYCRPRGSQPASIYGLSKIDKKDFSLRPIVSASGTFNYKLAKLLAKKLEHLRKSELIINNPFVFVEVVRSLKFDNSTTKMISFDTTSLFTKVPLDHTIEIILDKLYGSNHNCSLSKKKESIGGRIVRTDLK